MPTNKQTLQALYDAEINATFAWLYDKGFCWYLGDNFSGFKADGWAETFDDAVEDLCKAAVEHYPETDFAKNAKAEAQT